MSAPTSVVARISKSDVEDYLYAEAALLDAWSLDAWLQLFDDDAKYEVPCNDAPDGDPTTDLMLIDDDFTRLKARVERLGQVIEVSVSASFTVWRFRGGRSSSYVGQYRYLLRVTGAGLRIASKRAELDMTDLRAVSDVAIIL